MNTIEAITNEIANRKANIKYVRECESTTIKEAKHIYNICNELIKGFEQVMTRDVQDFIDDGKHNEILLAQAKYKIDDKFIIRGVACYVKDVYLKGFSFFTDSLFQIGYTLNKLNPHGNKTKHYYRDIQESHIDMGLEDKYIVKSNKAKAIPSCFQINYITKISNNCLLLKSNERMFLINCMPYINESELKITDKEMFGLYCKRRITKEGTDYYITKRPDDTGTVLSSRAVSGSIDIRDIIELADEELMEHLL
jgi:hypothetical protein